MPRTWRTLSLPSTEHPYPLEAKPCIDGILAIHSPGRNSRGNGSGMPVPAVHLIGRRVPGCSGAAHRERGNAEIILRRGHPQARVCALPGHMSAISSPNRSSTTHASHLEVESPTRPSSGLTADLESRERIGRYTSSCHPSSLGTSPESNERRFDNCHHVLE